MNHQIVSQCCGIDNLPSEIVLSKNLLSKNNTTSVLIGICPLISGKLPRDPFIEIPNKWCEFCFYFQAICSPKEFELLMKVISFSPHYDGEVTLEMLKKAKRLLDKKGITVKKIYSSKKVRCEPVKINKPIL